MYATGSLAGYSGVRESRIISNQQTIANETSIGTANNKFKRTVYHTPAIIQTVVDTPEPTLIQPPAVIPAARPFGSAVLDAVVRTTSRPEPYRYYGTSVNADSAYGASERGVGVKVNEDLSNLRPAKVMKAKEEGFMGKSLGFCCGRNCPWWVCCLVPLLLILLLLGLSYVIRRRSQVKMEETDIVAPIVSTDISGVANLNPNGPFGIGSQPELNAALGVPGQIPSTTTTIESKTTQISLNQPRQRLNPRFIGQRGGPYIAPINQQVPPPMDIYSRVRQRQNLGNLNSPNPQGQMGSETLETSGAIRPAPTLQEVLTKEMIDADRLRRSGSHHKAVHLRHRVS